MVLLFPNYANFYCEYWCLSITVLLHSFKVLGLTYFGYFCDFEDPAVDLGWGGNIWLCSCVGHQVHRRTQNSYCAVVVVVKIFKIVKTPCCFISTFSLVMDLDLVTLYLLHYYAPNPIPPLYTHFRTLFSCPPPNLLISILVTSVLFPYSSHSPVIFDCGISFLSRVVFCLHSIFHFTLLIIFVNKRKVVLCILWYWARIATQFIRNSWDQERQLGLSTRNYVSGHGRKANIGSIISIYFSWILDLMCSKCLLLTKGFFKVKYRASGCKMSPRCWILAKNFHGNTIINCHIKIVVVLNKIMSL